MNPRTRRLRKIYRRRERLLRSVTRLIRLDRNSIWNVPMTPTQFQSFFSTSG